MIQIENVSLTLGGARILRNVCLTLPRGGVTALIGPNGAGKSSLLSLVARLQPLQTGEITVDEFRIGYGSTEALARKLAIMPQDTSVSSRLSLRELVAFGRYPYHKGRLTAEDHAKVEAALQAFQLTGLGNRFLDTVSGGQRQRAFVAMVYAQETDYLLLDEPLNNLDIAASRLLMARLRDLAAEEGRTIVIVLHDINYAAAYADRVVVMKSGGIVANGAPAEIITDALLRDVFETRATVRMIENRPTVLV